MKFCISSNHQRSFRSFEFLSVKNEGEWLALLLVYGCVVSMLMMDFFEESTVWKLFDEDQVFRVWRRLNLFNKAVNVLTGIR